MKLGWYIHHHGRGHLHRFLAVAPHLGPVTVLSSLECPVELPGVQWRQLPMDAPVSDAVAGTVRAGGVLHWAPLGSGGYRDRMTAISAWIAETQPDAIVVDVSVEVALAARLAGVPVIWVAQRGRRGDLPHRLAFAGAAGIIAPWTMATEDPAYDPDAELGLGLCPAPGGRVHVGALSRFDPLIPSLQPERQRVLVLLGFGGHAISGLDLAEAARATPDWHWDVTGIDDGVDAANVTVHAADADVWKLLGCARVVVATASGNAVAEVAAARRPLILLPQARPFDEQHHQAAALLRAGLAEVIDPWPAPERWADLLARAAQRDPAAWAMLHDGGAGVRFAAAVHELACA